MLGCQPRAKRRRPRCRTRQGPVLRQRGRRRHERRQQQVRGLRLAGVGKRLARVDAVSAHSGQSETQLILTSSLLVVHEIQHGMRIAKRPFITSTIENHVIDWLVDTGASITCLSEELFRLFPENMVQKLTLPRSSLYKQRPALCSISMEDMFCR